MLLMVRGSLEPKRDFARARTTIHREVYGAYVGDQIELKKNDEEHRMKD